MTLSPRLTRAALTFLLFGTIAALFPAQDTTALAENGCFTGPAGSTGQYAIAPSNIDIRENYLLTATVTSYKFYYKTDAATAYTQISAGSNTKFVVNSGQVLINKKAYSPTNQPPLSTASSFPVSQVATGYNSFGVANAYAAGDITVTSTYIGSDPTGHPDTYTATVRLSGPAISP